MDSPNFLSAPSSGLPTYSSLGTKRKRSISYLPPDSANPLSHRPGTLKQFAVAGLSEREKIPSLVWPGFPHKAPREQPSEDASGRGVATAWAEDTDAHDRDETGDGDGWAKKKRRTKSRNKPPTKREHVLFSVVDALQISLSRGQIQRAKKLMAHLLRSAHMKNNDMRRHNLWALAAEIIMRDGEDEDDDEEGEDREGRIERDPDEPKRWGSARNVPELRRFLGDLIVQYPYEKTRPERLCALDFWWALLSAEVYSVHAEQTIALYRLGKAAQEWEEEADSFSDVPPPPPPMILDDLGDYGDHPTAAAHVRPPSPPPPMRESAGDRHAREQDRIRLKTLDEVGDILKRMEPLMGLVGYRSDKDMLNLQGMTLLYFADLRVPVYVESQAAKDAALRERDAIRERAKRVLAELIRVGGEVDYKLQHFLDMGGGQEMDEDEDVDEYEG